MLLFCAVSMGESDEEEEPGLDELGGVSIKVYRGPSRTKGKEVFAPFGYHVKMPAGGTPHKKEEKEEEDDNSKGSNEEDEEGFEFPDDDEEEN
ncbi:hypothetical protein TNCT_681631 [Trichonephila clavata]|uniref:Uncharacterized protein n=1 Tax=Trichonephila clavata TaxID=2740835 RepID=A0A8X6JLH9_TRICU|nr:hypothetical protein TNCT_681631 [Trichonephila clavata]